MRVEFSSLVGICGSHVGSVLSTAFIQMSHQHMTRMWCHLEPAVRICQRCRRWLVQEPHFLSDTRHGRRVQTLACAGASP